MDRMMEILHLIGDILRDSILITGLVVVMMMLIETLNIESGGSFFNGLKKTRTGQIILSALLGSIPGCIGGFASVSLYTHRMISFGALIAMMIASSGDEAFMIVAMVPDKALMIFAVLFVIAVASGFITDLIADRIRKNGHESPDAVLSDDIRCKQDFEVHDESAKSRKMTWKRVLMLTGVAVFIAALVSGILDHSHGNESIRTPGRLDLLDEKWMQYLFALLSIIVLGFLGFASDHFVEKHIWDHIVKKHLPAIFCWTFGVLLLIGIGLRYVDISGWLSGNTALMILLAATIGIIPESGPHLVFVTLYASGIVPLPVLLASSISQDGHSSLPLLAESKKSFAAAKLVNFVIALIAGYGCMALMQIRF